MKEFEYLQEFFTRPISLVNEIRSHGEQLSNQKIVEKILRSLPPKYDAIMIAIEETKDLTKYFVDELMGSLHNHEQRMNRNIDNSLEEAFETKIGINDSKEKGKQIMQIESSSNRGRV